MRVGRNKGAEGELSEQNLNKMSHYVVWHQEPQSLTLGEGSLMVGKCVALLSLLC